MTRVVKIEKERFSYGFELKDEGKPFDNYAVVAKVNQNSQVANKLKVGDKVIRINNEDVNRKYYISVLNNIRSSPNDCCELEIIDDSTINCVKMVESDKLNKWNRKKLLHDARSSRALIPAGSIKQKIKLFQGENLTNTTSSYKDTNLQLLRSRSRSYDLTANFMSKIDADTSNIRAKLAQIRSSDVSHNKNLICSCECLLNSNQENFSKHYPLFVETTTFPVTEKQNSKNNEMFHQDDVGKDDNKSSGNSNIYCLNQDPALCKEMISEPNLCLYNTTCPHQMNDKSSPDSDIFSNVSTANTEKTTDIISCPVFSVSEPFDDSFIPTPGVPKIDFDISNKEAANIIAAELKATGLTSSPKAIGTTGSHHCSSSLSSVPDFESGLSHHRNASKSSNNLLSDPGDAATGTQLSTTRFHYLCPEYSSMKDISSQYLQDQSFTKTLARPDSLIQSIPIKLRIQQYFDKKSKNWHDYVLENVDEGVRFRIRMGRTKKTKYQKFVINRKDVVSFTVCEYFPFNSQTDHKRKQQSQTLQQNPVEVDRPSTCSLTNYLSSETGNPCYYVQAHNNQVHVRFYFNHQMIHDSTNSEIAFNQFLSIVNVLDVNEQSPATGDMLSVFSSITSTNKNNQTVMSHFEQAQQNHPYQNKAASVSTTGASGTLSSLSESHDSLSQKQQRTKLSLGDCHSSNLSTSNAMCNVNFTSNRKNSTSATSVKSGSKSSFENISSTDIPTSAAATASASSTVTTTSSSKKVSQKFGRKPPEKKVVHVKTEIYSGTKAEFEEFQRSLEKGEMPMELDFCSEGTHFQKYIYQVPRTSILPMFPKLPLIIYICVKIVEAIGISSEGIYRRPANRRVLKSLMMNINKPLDEIDTESVDWNNIHGICGLLKIFLRKLKEYLIPASLSHLLAYSCKTVDLEDPNSLARTLMDIRYHLSSFNAVGSKPLQQQPQQQQQQQQPSKKTLEDQYECRCQTLQFLLEHLHRVVQKQHLNYMTEKAVAICFTPVIMEAWQLSIADIKASNDIMIKAVELMIIHNEWIFTNWDPERDRSRSLELMEHAFTYSSNYIKHKDDSVNPPVLHSNTSGVNSDDTNKSEDQVEDVRPMVRVAISQVTLQSNERRNLDRRHSSHTPGQSLQSSINKENVEDAIILSPAINTATTNNSNNSQNGDKDLTDNNSTAAPVIRNTMNRYEANIRKSKTADALDLSFCVNLISRLSRLPPAQSIPASNVKQVARKNDNTNNDDHEHDSQNTKNDNDDASQNIAVANTQPTNIKLTLITNENEYDDDDDDDDDDDEENLDEYGEELIENIQT